MFQSNILSSQLTNTLNAQHLTPLCRRSARIDQKRVLAVAYCLRKSIPAVAVPDVYRISIDYEKVFLYRMEQIAIRNTFVSETDKLKAYLQMAPRIRSADTVSARCLQHKLYKTCML